MQSLLEQLGAVLLARARAGRHADLALADEIRRQHPDHSYWQGSRGRQVGQSASKPVAGNPTVSTNMDRLSARSR
jgi:hypothetical protein